MAASAMQPTPTTSPYCRTEYDDHVSAGFAGPRTRSMVQVVLHMVPNSIRASDITLSIEYEESALGLVSRAWPVQTAMRNCTGDEGGHFGFGDQVADPKPPRAAAVKSRGGERRGNVGTMIPASMVERGGR